MTQEGIRGLGMILWASAVSRYPHLYGLPLYGGLARLVAWVGWWLPFADPAAIWASTGTLIGGGVLLASEIGERTGSPTASWFRRALAIVSISYWLGVAAGFAEASPTLPAVAAYTTLAMLHIRTAAGLEAR